MNRPDARMRPGISLLIIVVLEVVAATGCWAPLRSCAVPASALPDSFRTPIRTAGQPLNLATLAVRPPRTYILGPGDVLEVRVPGLYEGAEANPIQARVMGDGQVYLPLAGGVEVGGKNLLEAQEAITRAYKDYVVEPRISVFLAMKATYSVVVLGKVQEPGVHLLPKYENDVAHALAAAGGLAEDADDFVEIHRREDHLATEPLLELRMLPSPDQEEIPFPYDPTPCLRPSGTGGSVLRIPLRARTEPFWTDEDIQLEDSDVVVVPSRRHEVFYVVGKLGTTTTVRFAVGERERELGAGFVLPREREIDVITAVAMAGYIDPIDSPTTVTVHRGLPTGKTLLIHVDLIQARYDPRENILVWPGDIIYLNPDAPWYLRRQIDRIFPDILLSPYVLGLRRAILGKDGGGN